jgi:tRNA pseudouridine38-40 synthase
MRRKFHARHDAVARSYLYQISRRRTAFAKAFVWWVRDDLHLDRMRDVAGRFSGMNDFRSFTDDSADDKSTMVAIQQIDIAEDGDLILIRVEGSHFLWKMVRRIVGSWSAWAWARWLSTTPLVSWYVNQGSRRS